jgi:hypothetical protein
MGWIDPEKIGYFLRLSAAKMVALVGKMGMYFRHWLQLVVLINETTFFVGFPAR